MEKEIEKEPAKKARLNPLELLLTRRMEHLPLEKLLKALDLYKEKGSIPSVIASSEEEIKPLSLEDIHQCVLIEEELESIKKRKEEIIKDLQSKAKLEDELKAKIEKTSNPALLEDIYLPYRLKGRTAAVAAKEHGLEALANWIWSLGHGGKEEDGDKPLEEKAKEFLKEDVLKTVEDVLSETQNIIVEKIAEELELRSFVRNSILQRSKLKSTRGPKAKDKSKYKAFFDYQEAVNSLRRPGGSIRYLTMKKAEATNEVVLSFEQNNKEEILNKFERYAAQENTAPSVAEFLKKAASIALNSNVNTGIHYDTHKFLKESAENQILRLFSKELRKRLEKAPFGAKSIIGVDPAQDKKNCSIALLDEKGAPLAHKSFTIKEEKAWDEFYEELLTTVKKVSVEAIAILHTAHTNKVQKHLQELFQKEDIKLPVIPIYDQFCTIYSSSSLAKKELPDLNTSIRKAIFIGRSLQDPMNELVKVDPRFIISWVSPLDINIKKILSTMTLCVSSYVAKTGLDINTASISLLSRIFNVNLEEAQKIITRREEKAFENIGELKDLLSIEEKDWKKVSFFLQTSPVEKDIRPAYNFQPLELLNEEELKKDSTIKGIISSVTNFGIFVDIGLEYDALLHISDFRDREMPYGNLIIGQYIDVWLVFNDKEKQQATLSLKSPEERSNLRKRHAFKRRPRREDKKVRGKRPDGDSKEARGKRPDRDSKEARGKRKDDKEKIRKKKPEQRDPKTGALLKQDDSIYTGVRVPKNKNKKGPRAPISSKVITYNPFADLDKMLKKPKK